MRVDLGGRRIIKKKRMRLSCCPGNDATGRSMTPLTFTQCPSTSILLPTAFFFQEEDGIRDTSVTGVQTCALPICCYVIKTDLPETVASKQVVHVRYKDLTEVEMAFRTSKTVHLEMRPVYV